SASSRACARVLRRQTAVESCSLHSRRAQVRSSLGRRRGCPRAQHAAVEGRSTRCPPELAHGPWPGSARCSRTCPDGRGAAVPRARLLQLSRESEEEVDRKSTRLNSSHVKISYA